MLSMSLTRRELAGALGVSALAQPSRRPLNIVWISCEDTSPTYGCYGDSLARTPNLDRFASEGARYDNAYSVYPVCAPSRSSIITGMYPASIGSHHMRSFAVPPPEVRCFPEYLRSAGYYCTNNSKTDYNFNGASASPLSAWDESSNQAHWRNRERKDQPFFSVFNITTTHESQIRDPNPATQKKVAALTERADPANVRVPPYYPDTPIVRRDLANYYDIVSAMDRECADLLKQLDDDGLRDTTVVFHWGDHGWGMPRGKRWLYDSGTRVPLMIRWPGVIQPGSTVDDLVCLMDLGPTVLSLAGVPVPRHMHGVPFLGDQKSKPRDFIYMARDRMDETYDMMRSVRDKRFRYTRNYQPHKPYVQFVGYMEEMPTMKEMRRVNKAANGAGPQGPTVKDMPEGMKPFFAPEKPLEELYDTKADPNEIRNLAADPAHRATLERFRAVHLKFMKDTKDLGETPEVELTERMRPGGKWQTTEAPVLRLEGSRISATCPTAGASISYSFETGPRARWYLYTKPFPLRADAALRVKATRLGYHDSPEVNRWK